MNYKGLVKYIDYLLFMMLFYLTSIGIIRTVFPKDSMILLIYGYYSVRIILYIFLEKGKIYFSKSIVCILIYAFVSFMWSNYPSESFKSAVFYLIMPTLIMFFLISVYKFKEILRLIFVVGLFITVVSLFTIQIEPDKGIASNGEWIGVFVHKNPLGFSMFLYAVLTFFYFLDSEKMYKKGIYLLIMLVQGIILFNSGSVTSLVILLLGICLTITLALYRKVKNNYLRMMFTSLTLGAVFTFGIYLAMNINNIFGLLGRDLTFTGRTSIWNAIFTMMNNHWILGYGFDSFWIKDSATKNYVDFYMYTDVPHAHNNYIDIVANMGIIGLLVVVLSFICYVINNMRINANKKELMDYFSIVFLILLFIHEFNESYFIRPMTVSNVWCLYVLMYMGIKLKLKNIKVYRKKNSKPNGDI
ncbi:O-antigen ligase family protein [Bacillus cereus]|uniref:O-antigen ligase family protein n=2 Tax=Bacillus TaxID=1386 RepID=UPI0005E11558|nr:MULTISPECIES: O-antigen ligase [Bacillus]CEY30588.1 Lipid A core-O-antigen ligase and related enzymes [Streptococcus pneumoniae]ASI75439.1 hypothetical protein BA203_25585 [Bacillus cereus]MBR9688307.1 hypothetical protein [Bacillus cereus]MEB9967517.1 O-antigen ligase [Bacillus cereus]OLR83171.1 hypothetical protein BTO25_05305 [Bacillus sp. MB366]